MNVKNQKGAALVAVLITLAVLSILGAAFLETSISEVKKTALQEKKMKAYYAARSGADALASYIIKHPDEAVSLVAKTVGAPGRGSIDGSEFSVKVEDNPTQHEIVIKSTGIVDGNPLATVSLTINKNYDVFKYAIFTNSGLVLENSNSVKGDVGTNALYEIDLDGHTGFFDSLNNLFGGYDVTFNGDLYTLPGANIEKRNNLEPGHSKTLNSPVYFPEIRYSDFPSSSSDRLDVPNTPITNGGYYKDINKSVVIDTGVNNKIYMRVNNISMLGSSNLTIRGNGEVHMLVSDTIELMDNRYIFTDDESKLFIYYDNSKPITIDGYLIFSGAIYAPKAAVIWKSEDTWGEFLNKIIQILLGTGTGINGNIIADEFVAPDSSVVSIRYNNNLDLSSLSVEGFTRKQWGN